MSGFLNDLRFARRQLIKRPGYAAAAILTLALGIGANMAVFSVLNGYLLKPLPYPHGRRLVAVNESFPGEHQPFAGVSVFNYLRMKKDVSAFRDAALYARHDVNLTLSGHTQRVTPVFDRDWIPAFAGMTEQMWGVVRRNDGGLRDGAATPPQALGIGAPKPAEPFNPALETL